MNKELGQAKYPQTPAMTALFARREQEFDAEWENQNETYQLQVRDWG